MPQSELAIAVHDLDAAGKALQLPVRVEWVRSAMAGTDVGPGGRDGQLDLRVSRSGRDVVVHGTLRAELSVPCARCLEPAAIAVDQTISALAVHRAEASGSARRGHDENDPYEADLLAFEGDTLVLDDMVRDELLLAVPMIPLCSETCPGIRPEPSGARDSPGVAQPRPFIGLKRP